MRRGRQVGSEVLGSGDEAAIARALYSTGQAEGGGGGAPVNLTRLVAQRYPDDVCVPLPNRSKLCYTPP